MDRIYSQKLLMKTSSILNYSVTTIYTELMGVILIIEVLEYLFLRLLIYIKEKDDRVNSALKMVFEKSGGSQLAGTRFMMFKSTSVSPDFELRFVRYKWS